MVFLIAVLNKENLSLDALKQGDKITVSISVSNTGDFDAKETVQLYIRDKFASLIRPLRELKGYKKIFINKNDTIAVEFELSYENLGFYNEKGEYMLEKGEFEIYVGENCLTNNRINVSIS